MNPGEIRVATQLPDAEHAWIVFGPRTWSAAPLETPWLDLARLRLGEAGSRQAVPSLAGGPFDDVVYLPPVAPEQVAARDELAASLTVVGTPVLVQLLLGDRPPPVGTVVWDPTAALLAGDLAALASMPPRSSLLWPLLPGVTDAPDFIAEGCRHLATARVSVAQAFVPELTPSERRHLAEERDEATFDRLFHGPPPDPRAFARVAHGHGLQPFLPRPLPRPPLGGAGNREIAGLVTLAGELAERLGRGNQEVQALLRAGRWLDRAHHDVRALAREGHLGLLDWLDPVSREIVADWAIRGRSARPAADLAEYLGVSSGEEGTNE